MGRRRNILMGLLGWAVLAGSSFVFLGCGSGTIQPESTPAPSASTELRIHYFNDWHGHLEPFERNGQTVGGAARLYSLLEERRRLARSEGAESLLFVAGDILQGTPMSTVFRGRPDYELLNRMQLDAMSLGNHEFDYGRQVLDERIAQSEFPILAANVYHPDGTLFVEADTSLVTEGGLRVAVLGLVTQETAILVLPRLLEGLEFSDPVQEATKRIPDLLPAHEMVVVVSHCGFEVDRQLARIPGVDVVIGGHDQIIFEEIVDGVPVVQARDWGEYLGELIFKVENGEVNYQSNVLHPVDATTSPNPEIEAFVAGFRSRLGEEMNEVLTVARQFLDGTRDAVRTKETNLGNLLTDIVREMAVADVAVLNGGTIRAPIEAGEITMEKILEVLPFANQIVTVEVRGRDLQALMDRSSSLGPTDGAFLQISGFEAVLTEDGAQITVQGQPLNPEQTFQMATTDYLGEGGDGYELLVNLPRTQTGLLLNSVVVDWMRSQEVIDREIDGRLKRIPEEGENSGGDDQAFE